MQWRNIYRGFLMGMSDLIPGVSAGTIAVILGIYNRVLYSINNLFSKEWKRHFMFLFPIGIGMVSAILLLSNIMETLLEQFPQPTYFFFLGLIIGILPFLFIQANARSTFTSKHYFILIIAGLAIASMTFFKEDSTTKVWDVIGPTELLLLFLSGWLASTAMILPGVSGSFVLLLIGVYPTVIHAVSDLNLIVIGVVGLGILFGIIIMSKLLSYLLHTFPTIMYAIIIGMVSGSVIVIFPGINDQIWISLITLCLGLGAAVALGKMEYKINPQK
ncbi:DUF368 domain-containing protein [Chengkuizengella sediminis]|uniref:DUF368 domain-containing protein n=1 Tax=Chengkuizengella sediminis TaxID=1885917 RepID=UPI00138998D3|nr:DUF368 domain-containing protein [Chengkuizengella sediminis]NDI35295.1 DUF368 domain-containing protein [Chengkuizengella sediminis]